MASDSSCDNRKIENASNVFSFMYSSGNTYWKPESYQEEEWLQNRNLMCWAAIRLCLIISGWEASCLFHSIVIQLSAHKKKKKANCVRAVHQCNFHKWHLFPSSHPLDLWCRAPTLRALSDVFEQLPSARPQWVVQISSDLFCMAPWY